MGARTPGPTGDQPGTSNGRNDEKKGRGPLFTGFPAAYVAVLLVALAGVTGWLAAGTKERFGVLVALIVASCASGALTGFLVGAPGLASGDEATEKANEKGWADRLGVFGNWITGAAFVLVVANAGEITAWFSSMTRKVAASGNGDPLYADTVYQYALGAWMIAAAGLGFLLGFVQMVTTGRQAIEAAAKAKEAARVAESAAETALEAVDEVRATAARR